jgi:hypothetical protein
MLKPALDLFYYFQSLTMKTDACQNVSNAKKAQIVVQNALRELIAATGPAKNV